MKYTEIKKIKTNILDLNNSEIYPAEVHIKAGYFEKIIPLSLDSNHYTNDNTNNNININNSNSNSNFNFNANDHNLANDYDDYTLDFDGIMIPGFIDAHIHIESSLLTPANFAKAVVPYGTTSVIADPHEIANVCGIRGIEFMIEDASQVPFDFYFSAPSCVPATNFETNGACLDCEAIEELMKKDEIVALGEVMNFVGVINHDMELIDKLKIATKYKKPIDGHAPLLSGEDLKNYINVNVDIDVDIDIDIDVDVDDGVGVDANFDPTVDVGADVDDMITISTDHESVSFDEAIEKKKLGMKIMVREGSSAKNMETLFNIKDRIGLCSNQDFFGSVSVADFETVLKNPIFDFLVSDDKDPNDLKKGHLNLLIKKAIGCGIDPIEAIKMVTINPANHYNLDSGIIEESKRANFLLIDNLEDLNIKKTFISGQLVAEESKSLIESQKPTMENTFIMNKKNPADFDINIVDYSSNLCKNSNNSDSSVSPTASTSSDYSIYSVDVRVIELVDNEIITNEIDAELIVEDNIVQANIDEDILKLAVVERYGNNNIANAFIKGFNLKKGAFASSVAHDSHNIIVVGTNSDDMARAVNLIHENKGGLAVVFGENQNILKLPIAGLMSDEDVLNVSNQLEVINNEVNNLGCKLEAPFMTLSFMALLVIPDLRLSDKGLFDVGKFSFVDLIKDFN